MATIRVQKDILMLMKKSKPRWAKAVLVDGFESLSEPWRPQE